MNTILHSPVTKACLILAWLGLFAGKLFYDLVGGASDPLPANIANDLFNYWWPFSSYASAMVDAGTLPLWNPYTSIGNSFVGEIGSGLFNPTSWTIYFIDDVAEALLASQLLTVAVSMTGAYVYARYLNLHWSAIALCVTLFGYSAFTESFSHSAGGSSCWFPVILYLTHRCFDRPGPGVAVCLGLALAMCFFGGFANYFLYTCLIVGAYYTTLLALSWRKMGLEGAVQRFGLMFLAVCLMAGFIAVQLLPGYELSTLSVRDLNSATAFKPNSLWEHSSLALLFSNFFLPDRHYLFGIEAVKLNSGLFYLGGALFFIPFALFNRQFRQIAIALLAGSAVILLLILSTKLDALSFVQEIPFIGSLRLHARGMVYIEFLFIVLAALGVSSLSDVRWRDGIGPRPFLRWIEGLSALGLILGICILAISSVPQVSSLLGLFVSACIAAYCFMPFSRASMFGRIGWIVVVVIVLDVSTHRVNRFLVPAFSSADYSFAQQSIEDYKNREGHYRLLLDSKNLEDTYALANFGLVAGVPNVSAYDPLTHSRWHNFLRAMVGQERFDRIVSTSPLGWFYGDLGPRLSKLLRDNPMSLGLASVRYVYSREGLVVNEKALPRAYAVYDFVPTETEEQSLEAILDHLKSLDTLVVVENAEISFPARNNGYKMDRAEGAVQIVSHTPNEVELAVSVDKPAIVVLTDAFYPGWQASVNDMDAEIFRANSVFRAVEVPPGSHSVVFHYHPRSFYLGFAITLLTSFVALLLLIPRFRRLA